MDLEERLEEYKARYRKASLPDDMRQDYEQILAFVDAGMDPGMTTDFAGELATMLECNLDVLFPVAEKEEEINPAELVSEQRYDDLREALRNYRRLEGDVEGAILDQVPGEGDETLCVFPAPFQLTPEESPDPGLLGEVLGNLLGQFLHPTLLLRHPPHLPSQDLYDHVVIAGSSLHNLMRIIRCTAGLCPEQTRLHVAAVADGRFVESMRDVLRESEEFAYDETELKLDRALHEGMRRKLRQARRQLREDHEMLVEFEIHEGTIETLVDDCEYLRKSPTLLSLPLHFSGGGYDPASLKSLFQQYTSSEILTI